MDGLRDYHIERSMSEIEKQTSYVNTHRWNLEKWYGWTYLQSRNRHKCRAQTYGDQGGKEGLGWTGRWDWHIHIQCNVCCCCCCSVASVVSDSVRPHRWQPTRLPHPWDSPGKNTGVGCHFLLQCVKLKSESEVAQSCPTPSDPMDCSPPGSSVHGIFQARVLEWGAIAFSEYNV